MSESEKLEEMARLWLQGARAENGDHQQASLIALKQLRESLQLILSHIELQRALLRYLAQRFSDNYWAHNEAHRTKKTPGYPGHHGCRVRIANGSLEMHWYYNNFAKKKDGSGHAVYSEYIRKDLKYRYAKAAFNRAQGWERPVIDETEAGFEQVRIMNARLSEMRRAIKAILKKLDQFEAQLHCLTPPAPED